MTNSTTNYNGIQLGVWENLGDKVAEVAAHAIAFAVRSGDIAYRAINAEGKPDVRPTDLVSPIGESALGALIYVPRIVSSELNVAAHTVRHRVGKIGSAVVREARMLKGVITDKLY